MLADLLAGELFAGLLTFARVGTALMILPVFGEPYVLGRQRLVLGLLLSAALAPALGNLPPQPGEPARLALLVGGEIAVGIFIGAVTRLAMAALHVAGTIAAMQSGLSAAAFFDPNEATQGTLPGNLYATTALTAMVAADLHHLLLRALAASYARLPPGAGLPAGDAVQLLATLGDAAIRTGLELAAPLVLASIIANLALGVLGRLVPALQILSLAMPLQLLLALGLMLLTLAGVVAGFGRFLQDALAFLDAAGGG
jgi:flagellar biosynthetic protein FliR